VEYDFMLRIDQATTGADGRIAVNAPCACDVFTGDTDPANNTASVVVTAVAPPTRAPVREPVRSPSSAPVRMPVPVRAG
jgi:hypothetical protein